MQVVIDVPFSACSCCLTASVRLSSLDAGTPETCAPVSTRKRRPVLLSNTMICCSRGPAVAWFAVGSVLRFPGCAETHHKLYMFSDTS